MTSTDRAKMPQGTSVVLDARSLGNSYATIIPSIRPGMRILDVGCGTGAITAGFAQATGPSGAAVGIDSSDHLIAKGQADHANISNLQLLQADLFQYEPEEKFDLIVSARVLQWLSNPYDALLKFKTLLAPGGKVSVLDYNHVALEWQPSPPNSMLQFYRAFLQWRADAGMDNEIALHLPELFRKAGFRDVVSLPADEVYTKGAEHFEGKLRIWSVVAESRGKQMVENGYVTEAERLAAIKEYDAWIKTSARQMTMKLTDVQGAI